MKVLFYCTKKGEPFPDEQGNPLNGLVCYEAEVDRIEKWRSLMYDDDYGNDEHGPVIAHYPIFLRCGQSCTTKAQTEALLNGSCLSARELYGYATERCFYAWHIKNGKRIAPYPPKKRAPQSWRYEDGALLVSINPQWLNRIMKGEKTIEIRTTAPKELVREKEVYE